MSAYEPLYKSASAGALKADWINDMPLVTPENHLSKLWENISIRMDWKIHMREKSALGTLLAVD